MHIIFLTLFCSNWYSYLGSDTIRSLKIWASKFIVGSATSDFITIWSSLAEPTCPCFILASTIHKCMQSLKAICDRVLLYKMSSWLSCMATLCIVADCTSVTICNTGKWFWFQENLSRWARRQILLANFFLLLYYMF